MSRPARPSATVRLSLALVICAIAAGTALADVYKWTDPSGRVIYGDKPPEDSKAQQVKIDVRSYEGPVEVTDWGAIVRRKSPQAASSSASITMYSTKWCPYCKKAKAYFASRGLQYHEIDIEASDAARREYKELGGKGVPLIFVGKKRMQGFSERAMDALLKG